MTTNETFKWSDLKDELRHRAKQQAKAQQQQQAAASGVMPKLQVEEVEVPKNIYDRGMRANLGEVLWPPSCRPCKGFEQARKAGGAMTRFPIRGGVVEPGAAPDATASQAEAAPDDDDADFDEGELEYDYDSDDGANLPGAAMAGHAHAD